MKRYAALAAGILTAAVLWLAAPTSAARPCAYKGTVILDREGTSCKRAKTVLAYYRSTVRSPRGWECSSGVTLWRGYCESRHAYFRWRPV